MYYIVRAEEKGHACMQKTARAFHSVVGAQRKSKDRAYMLKLRVSHCFFFLMWEEIYENRKEAEKDSSFTSFHLENVCNQTLTIKHVSLVYSVVHRQSKKLGTSSSLSIAGRRNGWDHCTSGLDSTLTKLKTSLTDWLMWKMSKVTITSTSFTMSARSESLPDTKQGKYNKK